MLSAKQVRIHGMKNEKWNVRERNHQYRGILRLYEREKKLQASNAVKLKGKVTENVKNLTNDIEEYRKIVNDVIHGDKMQLRLILQKQKDLKILLQDTAPLDACNVIFQDYDLKRKQLDKLLYLKKKKEKKFCLLKTEFTELLILADKKNEITPQESQQTKQQQRLIVRCQVAVSKRHAAECVNSTYRQIIFILKKDAKYFDVVLNALRDDQKDQSRVMYRITLMGQLAAEDLDDIRQRYKKMAEDVWVNMKERDRNLESARRKADDVWQYAKSLVRIESEVNILKKKDDSMDSEDKKLLDQIQKLEETFNIMKETMLIRSYEELFVRLEDQMKQREKLSHIYNCNLKDRDFAAKKKDHAELLLQTLEHSMISTTTKYKSDKHLMLKKIQEEKERETQIKALIETRGELLMNIRAALQSMSSTLICIKAARANAGKGKDTKKNTEDKVEIKPEEKGKKDKRRKSKGPCDDPIEADSLALLSQVTKKATNLFGMTNFTLNVEKREKAKDAYQNYVAEYRSDMKFGLLDDQHTGIFFEHEAADTGVLTRAEIKKKSKLLVELHSKED